MKSLLVLFLIFNIALLSSPSANAADIIVVANIDKKALDINKRQLRDLFMGSGSNLNLTPFALRPKAHARTVFNTKVIGLTESRIQSYWAQMRFSGRKKPPLEFSSEEAIIERLLSTKNSIAYLSADTAVPDGLVVVFRTE